MTASEHLDYIRFRNNVVFWRSTFDEYKEFYKNKYDEETLLNAWIWAKGE